MALGNNGSPDKLINLDSPPIKTTPPVPPPRTSSDPNYGKLSENGNENNNISVTYFSTGLNGIERETIFADDKSSDAASIVRQHLNPFNPKNPFLATEEEIDEKKDESLDDIVEKKIQDLINANPFSGSKFNTIGRSNPFSNTNPFLESKDKMTSSGEDVNDSPDSSLEPEDEMINKIVSCSRIAFMNRIIIQKFFGHNYLIMPCSHAPIGTTILDTSW